jgi:hypothetical protein
MRPDPHVSSTVLDPELAERIAMLPLFLVLFAMPIHGEQRAALQPAPGIVTAYGQAREMGIVPMSEQM